MLKVVAVLSVLVATGLVGCTKCGQEATPPPPAADEGSVPGADVSDSAEVEEAAPSAEGADDQPAAETDKDLEMPQEQSVPDEQYEVE